MGSIPGSGRSPGEGNGNLLQYSCLENSMDRGACRLQSWNRKELTNTFTFNYILKSYNYKCKIHWKPTHQRPSNPMTNSQNYWEFCQYPFRCYLPPGIVLAFSLWVLFIQPAGTSILHVSHFRCLAFLKCSSFIGEWMGFLLNVLTIFLFGLCMCVKSL